MVWEDPSCASAPASVGACQRAGQSSWDPLCSLPPRYSQQPKMTKKGAGAHFEAGGVVGA